MNRPTKPEPQDVVRQAAEGHPARETRGAVGSLEQVGDLFLASDSFALALNEYSKIADLDEWEKIAPERRSAIELKIGRARTGLGDLDGALSAGTRALDVLRDAPQAPARTLGLARAFLANTHRRRGEHAPALEHGLRALQHLNDTNENSELASLQLNVGAIYLREGKLRDAEGYYQDALATYRRIGDRGGAAKAFNGLGVVYNNLCEWQSAASCLRRAAQIDESLGNFAQTAIRCLNLGIVLYHVGDWGSAQTALERSLEMSRSVGDAIGVARASIALARIERWRHAYYRADHLTREAIAATRESGARREAAAAVEEAGALALARGDLPLAQSRFEEALAISAEIASVSDHTAEVQRRIAEVALRRDELELAFDRARVAYGAAARVRDRRMAAAALRVLGSVFRRRGEVARARSSFTRSIRTLERIGATIELARTLHEAGRLEGEQWCSPQDARGYLIRSEALYRDLDLVHEIGAVRLDRARLEIALRDYQQAMSLVREAERTYSQIGDDRALREVFALRSRIESDTTQAAASLDNEFLTLRRVARSREADLTAVFGRIVENSRADRGFVIWERGGRLAVKACEGMSAATARELFRRMSRQHADRVARGEAVISYGDFAQGSDDILSYIVVPIGDTGRGSGLLYVDRVSSLERMPFGRLELHFVTTLTPHLAKLLTESVSRDEPLTVAAGSPFVGVVTRSPRMIEILDMLKRVAGSSSTILLQGETGTGKGLLAQEVSGWSDGPFVTINCADLSETVLESELFGHARNAFTGAGAEKKGLFEHADGGTVFIDEIDKTSRNFQERLLRVVDRREIKPVGSTSVKKVACRIIVAANRDLRGQVERGEFLKDLYYRLRVISIDLPPLRDRREDIPLLTEHFLRRFQAKMGKSGIHFAPKAMECLENHDWSGNIRDLENEVERAVALSSSGTTVEPLELSEETRGLPAAEAMNSRGAKRSLASVVEEVEIRMVREALKLHDGNKSRAAAELGLTRRGLKNKIARYKLE